MGEVTVRAGGVDDVPDVLGLLDRASEWLVSVGRTDQWGTRPHSTSPRRVEQVTGLARDGGMYIAERDGRAVGALAIGAALPHIPAATEPEVYVRLLVSDRLAAAGRGAGAVLLEQARTIARERGVKLLRVDCFRGGGGALVRYYEGQGFTRTEPFDEHGVDGSTWPGQVLAQQLD